MRLFSFNLVPSFQFSLRTRQANIISAVKHVKKSRDQLYQEIEDPDRHQRLLEIQKQKQIEETNLYFQNHFANDQNPNNHIQVKIQPPRQSIQEYKQPLIIHKVKKPQKILIKGIRRNIHCSTTKVIPQAKMLIGQHIDRALEMCKQLQTKPGRYLYSALNMVKANARDRGHDEQLLYVHGIITGRLNRSQRIRYNAKGKGTQMIRQSSQVTVFLEEKPALEFFKDALRGKTTSILASYTRNQLVQTDANYDQVRALSGFLTAKGRQQQRLMLKRRILKQYREGKTSGRQISMKVIENQILESEAQKLVDEYQTRKVNKSKYSLQDRQTLYKRNEETNV
ncbi:hypothetical protein pb186bvf_005189 [Paramecium bursaria]